MSLDNAAMTVYGDSISGNCLKVKFVAARLGLPFDWVEVSVLAKQTRTPEFLAINPAGQVPVVRFADNNVLAQSKAIILYLAVGSDLIPGDAFERAQMYQWLFWNIIATRPPSPSAVILSARNSASPISRWWPTPALPIRRRLIWRSTRM